MTLAAIACDFPGRFFAGFFGLSPVGSMGLHRATFKVGAPFNGKSLVMNIANDISLRL
jgi:hypothetical protein